MNIMINISIDNDDCDDQVQVEGESVDEDPGRRSSGEIFWSEARSGGEDHQKLRDSWKIYFVQTSGLISSIVCCVPAAAIIFILIFSNCISEHIQ